MIILAILFTAQLQNNYVYTAEEMNYDLEVRMSDHSKKRESGFNRAVVLCV